MATETQAIETQDQGFANTFIQGLNEAALRGEDITPYLEVNTPYLRGEDLDETSALRLFHSLENKGLSKEEKEFLLNQRYSPKEDWDEDQVKVLETNKRLDAIRAKEALAKYKLDSKPIERTVREPVSQEPYIKAVEPVFAANPDLAIKVTDPDFGEYHFSPVIEDNPDQRKAFMEAFVNSAVASGMPVENAAETARQQYEIAVWYANRDAIHQAMYEDIKASVTEALTKQRSGVVPRGSGNKPPVHKSEVPKGFI